MKKLIIFFAMCVLFLSGCGNKSDKEVTDIEQFRCQDSIETVFSVLGEVELESSAFGGEYYKYDNLNLWGYNGEVVFRVRDDKETIAFFYCNLKLNKKEFEDILSQLTDKYGEYEKKEYSNQIAYVWRIPEDEAKEIGYNKITFSDYGDKKAVVDFSDEWSIYKDEAYYKHLEEESKINVLAEKTYNIEDDTFQFVFEENKDGYNLSLLCDVNDKSDAFWTHISLNALFNSQEESLKLFIDDLNFHYMIFIGDGTVLTRGKNVLILMSKDGEMMSTEDYFSADWMVENMDKDSDYGEKVINFLVEFIEKE